MVYTKRAKATKKAGKRAAPRPKPRRTSSLISQVAKTIYQVVSALPILPAPIKSGADWIARQFGLTNTLRAAGGSFVMLDGAVNSCEWAGFVRTDVFISGSSLGGYDEHTETLTTNVKTIRPLTLVFRLSPQNPVQNRAGYYTMAFMPSTGPESYNYFNSLVKDQLGFERLINRCAYRGRWPAARGGRIRFRTPKTNAYLHQGVPLRQTGDKSTEDVIGFLVVIYSRDDRTEYKDFTADEVAFDLRIDARALPMQVDPLQTQAIFGGRIIKDYNAGNSKYVFKNPTTNEIFKFNEPTWDPKKKGFVADASKEIKSVVGSLEEMELH